MKTFYYEYKQDGKYKTAQVEAFTEAFAQALFFDRHPEVSNCYLLSL
jgi:hypothetical protein